MTAVGTMQRLERVQQKMNEQELNVIVAYKVGGEAYAYGGQGYFRYLAPGISPLPIPPAMVVVPVEGPATAILYRGLAAVETWESESLRIETCDMTSMKRLRSEKIVQATARVLDGVSEPSSRIGVVLLDELPQWLVAGLRTELARCEMVDATEMLDRLIMIKTPAELEGIRRAALLAEDVIAVIFDRVRPGVTELAVTAEAKKEAIVRGAEYADIRLASSNPERGGFGVGPSSLKPVDHGDHLHIGIDICLDGFWVNVVRRGVVGSATDEYASLCELIARVFLNALGGIVIDRRVGDIAQDAENTVAAYVTRTNEAIHYEFQRMGHGIGFENQEPPFFVSQEEMTVGNGMTFALHPGVLVRGLGHAALGGIVAVTSAGTYALTDFSREVAEVK